MKLFKNAISSIQIGVEDLQANDDDRLLSAMRSRLSIPAQSADMRPMSGRSVSAQPATLGRPKMPIAPSVAPH